MAPSYAASKGGVANLTRQLALNWAPAVRVNCVCPGVIETLMTAELRKDPAWRETVLLKYPLGRFGQPEEIAAAILYLASDDAAYVTGVALPVDRARGVSLGNSPSRFTPERSDHVSTTRSPREVRPEEGLDLAERAGRGLGLIRDGGAAAAGPVVVVDVGQPPPAVP